MYGPHEGRKKERRKVIWITTLRLRKCWGRARGKCMRNLKNERKTREGKEREWGRGFH